MLGSARRKSEDNATYIALAGVERMAIAFARSERISRGKGGNAVRSAAYAMREKLFDERTGETHKFKNDGTLEHAGVLLPDGADHKFLAVATLFNAIEGAESRKDAQVARVIVIALDPGLSPAERIEMSNGFARQMFADKGFPVLVCVHSPHDGLNPHAHLIGGTRPLTAEGFAAKKPRETPFWRIFGRAVVLRSERERVGELWRDFQNQWFSDHGKAITVDPVGPIPQEHIGPLRFRSPNDHRIAANEQARELNAKIARDPQALAEHVRKQAQSFDVRKFLTKYLPADEVRTRLHNLQREALQTATWSDKTDIGSPQTVEYVARQLSSKYDELLKRAAAARKDAAQVEWARNRQDIEREAAVGRVAERWGEMGIMRRVAHVIGTKMPSLAILQDLELKRWTDAKRKGIYLVDNKAIRLGALTGAAKSLLAEAAEVLDKKLDGAEFTLRQAAEIELIKRQRIARNARERIDTLRRDDRMRLRVRRSQSRGPSL